MRKEITHKQYLNALRVVDAYQKQMQKKRKDHFTLDDLEILTYSVSIPSLSEDVVDDNFVMDLTGKLEERGFPVLFISLDDMGYISIRFWNCIISVEQINAVLDSLNSK